MQRVQLVITSKYERKRPFAARPDRQPSPSSYMHDRYLIPYPTGVIQFLLRLPLVMYRMGLGDLMNVIHLMVLTTRGRRSAQPRAIPIEYRRHGTKIYLISGWGPRPQWYQNILADPDVTVQMGRRVVAARGTVVTDPAEALRAIYLFRRVAPARYDAVLGRLVEAQVNARTLPTLSSKFTVVRLDLVPGAAPLPAVASSRAWVAPAALIAAALALAALARQRRS